MKTKKHAYEPASLDEVRAERLEAKELVGGQKIRQHPHVPAGLKNSTSDEVYSFLKDLVA